MDDWLYWSLFAAAAVIAWIILVACYDAIQEYKARRDHPWTEHPARWSDNPACTCEEEKDINCEIHGLYRRVLVVPEGTRIPHLDPNWRPSLIPMSGDQAEVTSDTDVAKPPPNLGGIGNPPYRGPNYVTEEEMAEEMKGLVHFDPSPLHVKRYEADPGAVLPRPTSIDDPAHEQRMADWRQNVRRANRDRVVPDYSGIAATCPRCGITVLKSSDSTSDYCSSCARQT